jgi:hypothetical protein
MANVPGGGYGSKVVTHTNAHKVAHPSTRAVRPGSADMLGQALAFEPPIFSTALVTSPRCLQPKRLGQAADETSCGAARR